MVPISRVAKFKLIRPRDFVLLQALLVAHRSSRVTSIAEDTSSICSAHTSVRTVPKTEYDHNYVYSLIDLKARRPAFFDWCQSDEARAARQRVRCGNKKGRTPMRA
jgi:hypothetical protein